MELDFNMKKNYYGHEYYERWNFTEKEIGFLSDIFQLPYEDEITLFTYNQYFKIIKQNMTKNISEFYKRLPYKLFLASPYWKILSNYKKKKSDKKCMLCNSKKLLQTHHNNYNNKGYEYKNLNDLIVLCGECHKKFHNK